MPFCEVLSTGNLLNDTQVSPHPHRADIYRAIIDPAFVAFSAQGGLLMAIGLRAIELRVDRQDLTPLSAHALYCEPVPAGHVEVEVQVLRAGNSVAQACAQLRIVGSDAVAVHITATLARPRSNSPFAFEQRIFPKDVPPVEILPEPTIPEPILDYLKTRPLFFQSDFKIAVGHQPWDPNWKPGPGRFAAWARMHNSPMLADGRFDPLCYAYLCDVLAPAMLQALGPEAGALLHTPTLNFDVQFLRPTRSEWLLIHANCHESRDGFGHGTVELWDEEQNLVAIASQRGLVRSISG